ncbi:hypothetical protein LTR37_014734 [Vermiconidia calcicola]|uniref:Uncharacterized protein n=1 Tax=Vermiconidia calcicola TaxID=1690605 RepID=A0ACC3MST3_9PEZI|nr:hypothetical protein LTR37_014734 [Vermiconidia calcicola]
MASTRSEFVDFIYPLRQRMRLYDPTKPPTDQPKNDASDPTRAIPQGFIDAMIVREAVFVEEQGVPLENELDEDDQRSFHWTAYASIPVKAKSNPASPEMRMHDEKMGTDTKDRHKSTSTKIPVGTIRLVPPPHEPHPNGKHETDVPKDNECYVKLGRLSVIKEFRKAGISKLLIETALAYARQHPYELLPQVDATAVERMNQEGVGTDFRGLVLVHAQTGVQKLWRKYGFETDESMGTWDEEGMEHVGMWKRVDVSDGRRRIPREMLLSERSLLHSSHDGIVTWRNAR